MIENTRRLVLTGQNHILGYDLVLPSEAEQTQALQRVQKHF